MGCWSAPSQAYFSPEVRSLAWWHSILWWAPFGLSLLLFVIRWFDRGKMKLHFVHFIFPSYFQFFLSFRFSIFLDCLNFKSHLWTESFQTFMFCSCWNPHSQCWYFLPVWKDFTCFYVQASLFPSGGKCCFLSFLSLCRVFDLCGDPGCFVTLVGRFSFFGFSVCLPARTTSLLLNCLISSQKWKQGRTHFLYFPRDGCFRGWNSLIFRSFPYIFLQIKFLTFKK